MRFYLDLEARDGAASVLATLVCLPVMVLLIALAAYFGRAYYAKFALEDAAATGARWAQTSLGSARSCDQVLATMRTVLKGYALDAEAVRLSARVLSGATSRRRQIEIRASFAVDQSAIPVYGWLWGDSLLMARYVVFVDQNINRQRDGWTGCAQT